MANDQLKCGIIYKKLVMQAGDDKQKINFEWLSIKKLLWFPGMGADFIK